MKDRVVCISESGFHEEPYPKVNDICVVTASKEYKERIFYKLLGYTNRDSNGLVYGFVADNFRPVDDTFGEWVEETIMKEVELETILQ